MTQEDKELLLKDLCARLPYGIRAQDFDDEAPFTIVSYDGPYFWDDDEWEHRVDKIKPYLFPLSSMTEEQNAELMELMYKVDTPFGAIFSENIDYFDWLNKNHFDYRGLIEKGLALDATGLNIYKNND
jgi:hypothetical protein